MAATHIPDSPCFQRAASLAASPVQHSLVVPERRPGHQAHQLGGNLGQPQPVQQPSGGGEGIRTHDPLVANQVLYQLSYAPVSPAPVGAAYDIGAAALGRHTVGGRRRFVTSALEVVGLTGLEPVTSRLSGGCSNQLSYRPSSARKAEALRARCASRCGDIASRLRGEPGLQVRFVSSRCEAPRWSPHRPADPTRDEREGDPCLCANNLRFAIQCSARSELLRAPNV